MAAEERTYGNWRKPVTPGIGRLGLLGTMILMVGLVSAVLAMLVAGVIGGLVVGAGLVVLLVPLVIQDRHGRTALQAGVARISWWRGRSAGWHLYRSGPLGLTTHGSCRLPGLLATSRLVEAEDTYGRRFAMVVMPGVGHYSTVLECSADGAALVDQEQVDTWIAYWGQWLASLAFEPGLVGAQVTVETTPDLGHRLRREVAAQQKADAPALAREILSQIVDSYPAGSAQVVTRIALTYAASPRPGAKRRDTEEMAREIGTRLPGLTQKLGMTGAGTTRPMTADEVASAVRVAYDPACQSALERAGRQGVAWEEAGPTAAQESWSMYRHDSGTSVTWLMSEAPRGEVLSNVLTGLIGPHRDIARKRVTLCYRPYDPGDAAQIVERDRKDARFRVTGLNTAARDTLAVTAADQTAREEARGAGVVRFSMLVTATVLSSKDLPAAVAAVETLAPPARVQLRRAAGSQAAAFVASLPLGVILPSHLQVPQFVREMM